MSGRTRHIPVGTAGVRPVVVAHAANTQASGGATLVRRRALGWCPRLRPTWADQGYKARCVAWAPAATGWGGALVTRPAGTQGFRVRPRRWVVERTSAWPGRPRRRSNDDAGRPGTREAWGQVAMTHPMLTRLAPP